MVSMYSLKECENRVQGDNKMDLNYSSDVDDSDDIVKED